MAKGFFLQLLSCLAGNMDKYSIKFSMQRMKKHYRKKSINTFWIINGEGNVTKKEKNVYFYFDGEVSVEQHGWEEITDFQQIVNRLLQ